MYGFSGVVLGAITGHDARVLEVYLQVAQQYFFFHTLALLFVASLLAQYDEKSPRELVFSGVFFIVGAPSFSASLFYKVSQGVTVPMLMPLGGTLMMMGWLALVLYGIKRLLK